MNTYQYFEDQFLRLCYKHKFHHSEWWTYFKMPNFPPGGPPGHAMLPPVVPRLEEDARPPRARPAAPPPPRREASPSWMQPAGPAPREPLRQHGC